MRTGKEVRMGSEKKQEREGAGLRQSEGRSKGRRETVQEARIRGLDEGHQRLSQLLTGSSPAHFAGFVPASILSVGCAALTLPALL